MSLTSHIAKNLREVYFGGNWTWSNFKEQLADLTWEQATTQLYDWNTIAVLVYHVHYYNVSVAQVLAVGPLDSKDEYSFQGPPITNEATWQQLLAETWAAAEKCAALIEQLPDSALETVFTDEKYGTYFRNLHGIIEHAHYHLGQIALVRKVVRTNAND